MSAALRLVHPNPADEVRVAVDRLHNAAEIVAGLAGTAATTGALRLLHAECAALDRAARAAARAAQQRCQP